MLPRTWTVLLCGMIALSLHAQGLATIYSFDIPTGFVIQGSAPLLQCIDGNFYGTTSAGGTGGPYPGVGTVYKVSPSGAHTTLYNFCSSANCTDGQNPNTGLVQAANGNLYGTTNGGGANAGPYAGGAGSVFKITPTGVLTTVYSFCSQSACADGANPTTGLVLATNGDLYGTTNLGGTNTSAIGSAGCGTVFKMTLTGSLTTLYSFCSQSACADGAEPNTTLLQAASGELYGSAYYGGMQDNGTIFSITPTGTLTTLYSLSDAVSGAGSSGLIQGSDGNLYGTTHGGGAHSEGTVFRITPAGKLKTLYSFCAETGCTDGAGPAGSLVQATDGNFYGTTVGGGTNGGFYGTIFKVTSRGELTTLYSFCTQSNCADGENPYQGLIQDTDGSFYGTTSWGGAFSDGAAFSLAVGLAPFVKPQPSSGKVGAVIEILGTNLTGATSVTFSGTAATFKVASSSLIVAAVPAGASDGNIQVVTPTGTLSSNVPFRVLP